MLRRKLLVNLGALIVLLMLTAIIAIGLLQSLLRDMQRLNGPEADSRVQTDMNQASPVEPIAAQQQVLARRFFRLVLGLSLVFLLVINLAVVILLRMASLVVKPVEKLAVATREFGLGHFDFRIPVDGADEFGELARAYNAMGDQLQAGERQRLQTLSQAAVTMNHELNNAIAIIDMQLQMLSRKTADKPQSEPYLRQIQKSLGRVTDTVQSLKNVRRIVLTDYLPGTKMLDLKRSTEDEQSATGAQET